MTPERKAEILALWHTWSTDVYTSATQTQLLCAVPELLARVEELEDALKAMVDQEVEYMTINNLGDPEKQHSIRRARAVLEGKP